MKTQGSGCIVNATTGAGKVPESSRLPTSVSRAAGINLTKSLANEFAKDKIRVNAICIGKIKSAQWERRSKGQDIENYYADLGKSIPQVVLEKQKNMLILLHSSFQQGLPTLQALQ